MNDDSTSYIARIQQCEAAIVRIRTAIRAGQSDSTQVANDIVAIQTVTKPIFIRWAMRLGWVSPLAVEETFEALDERLLEDIWKLTSFPSLETGFGAYLKTMPPRIVGQIKRKNTAGMVSSIMERLDAPIGDDGMPLHEAVSDPRSTAETNAVGDREALEQALQQLSPMERRAFLLRADGTSNNDVAEELGVSPSTASRLYDRAKAKLTRSLRASEEC